MIRVEPQSVAQVASLFARPVPWTPKTRYPIRNERFMHGMKTGFRRRNRASCMMKDTGPCSFDDRSESHWSTGLASLQSNQRLGRRRRRSIICESSFALYELPHAITMPSESFEIPWTLFSRYGHVLVCIAEDPHVRMRDIAATLDITERSVQKIILRLEEAKVVTREREGRNNRYKIHYNRMPEHPFEQALKLREFLDLAQNARMKAARKR